MSSDAARTEHTLALPRAAMAATGGEDPMQAYAAVRMWARLASRSSGRLRESGYHRCRPRSLRQPPGARRCSTC